MNIVSSRYYLDLTPGGYPTRVPVSQGDTGRELIFWLVERGAAFSVPQGATVALEGGKPDGHFFRYENLSHSGSQVTVPMETQMAAVAGEVECQLVVELDGTRVGTANFFLSVEREALPADGDLSASDAPLVRQAIEAAPKAISAAATATKMAQEAANSAAGAFGSASVAQQSATAASGSASAAADSAALAGDKATAAASSASTASAAQSAAKASETNAKNSATAAASSASGAAASASAAQQSAIAAGKSATAASDSATAASESAASAQKNAEYAAASAAEATNASTEAKTAANTATQKATAAASSASTASAAQSAAKTSETNAKESETAAAASAATATQKASAAADAADEAHTWATAAAQSAQDAAQAVAPEVLYVTPKKTSGSPILSCDYGTMKSAVTAHRTVFLTDSDNQVQLRLQQYTINTGDTKETADFLFTAVTDTLQYWAKAHWDGIAWEVTSGSQALGGGEGTATAIESWDDAKTPGRYVGPSPDTVFLGSQRCYGRVDVGDVEGSLVQTVYSSMYNGITAQRFCRFSDYQWKPWSLLGGNIQLYYNNQNRKYRTPYSLNGKAVYCVLLSGFTDNDIQIDDLEITNVVGWTGWIYTTGAAATQGTHSIPYGVPNVTDEWATLSVDRRRVTLHRSDSLKDSTYEWMAIIWYV